MLIDGLTKTETHVTVRTGRLSGEQFKALILDGLKRELGIARNEFGVDLDELTIGSTLMSTKWPDVQFSLTTDHLWHRKPTPADEA